MYQTSIHETSDLMTPSIRQEDLKNISLIN